MLANYAPQTPNCVPCIQQRSRASVQHERDYGCWRQVVGARRGAVRFVHLEINWEPSFTKSRGISKNSWIWSDMIADYESIGRVE
jgi:hypothetical protein